MTAKNFRVRNGIDVGPATGSNNNVTIDGATGNIVTIGDATVKTVQATGINNADIPSGLRMEYSASGNKGFLTLPDGNDWFILQACIGPAGNYSELFRIQQDSQAIFGNNIFVPGQVYVTNGGVNVKFPWRNGSGTRTFVGGVFDYDNTNNITRLLSNGGVSFYKGTTADTLTNLLTVDASGNLTTTGSLSNAYFTLPNATGTTGQVLTSNGSTAPAWTSLSGLAVTSITGTANQIIASSSTGAVTLSTPQAIGTTSNVNFNNITAAGNLSNNYFTLPNSTGTSGQVLTSNGATAPAWTTPTAAPVSSVSGSGAGILVSPTTGAVVVSNTGVTSLVGTANQIIVSTSTGAVTLTTPQDIGTTSAVNFGSVTTSGNIAANGGSITTTNTTGNIFNTTATTLNIGGAATTTNIGATNNTAVTNVNNNLKMNRDGSMIFSLPNYNGSANASTGPYDATRRYYSTFSQTITSASGTGTTATLFFTPVAPLNGVGITSTTGDFICTNIYGNTIFTVGQTIQVSGTLTGTGTITGYSNPTTYYIIATNGSTTFQLSASLGGSAITTTAGTTVGLAFSDPEYPPPFAVGAKILVANNNGTVSSYHGVQTVTACTANSVSYLSSATGAYAGGGTITLFESIGVKGISLSNADTLDEDTWLNFRTYGAESTNTPGGQSVIQYETTRGSVDLPLPPQNGDFLGAFYLQTNLGSAADATIAGSRTITTAASGTGSVATLTYASTGVATYQQGTWITISGVIPTAYNGTYQVLTASATQVTYYSTATGSMTQAGIIANAGNSGIAGTAIGQTAGVTAAMNMTTDMFRFPPQQFAAQATEQHRMINLGTFTGAATTAGVLTVSSISTTATTAASGTGSQATLTFATPSTNSPPFPPGSLINVEGMTPAGYNGTYQVLTCTTTQVTYASATTGSQTVAGTIKAYIATGYAFKANTSTTPQVRSSPAVLVNQLTITNANGLAGAEGTYSIGGAPTPIAYTDTCTYYTFASGMGMAFDQAPKGRVYNPSTRVRTLSLQPEYTEINTGQLGISPQPYTFTDFRRLLLAITGGNTLNIAYHGLKVGDTVSPQATGNGLTINVAYYVATVVDQNNITLSSTSDLATPVTGLTNATGINRSMNVFTNPTNFNLNLRNFRANFTSNNSALNAIPNVLNDQLGSITFSGNRTGSIASQSSGTPNVIGNVSLIQSQAAAITAQATADWTVTSTPSKLVFATTASGSVTPTTAMTVASNVITMAAPIAFPVYTAAAAAAITGAVGWQISISNSPTSGGRMAFWDTTNSRWSYISDNSAV